MFYSLLILIAAVLLSTALTTPLVYSGLLYFIGESPWPFSRVFDRVAMFWAALLIWKFRNQLSLKGSGVYLNAGNARARVWAVCAGALISAGCVLLVLPLLVQVGTLNWAVGSLDSLLIKLPKVLVVALLVSIIEESFFRLFLFKVVESRFSILLSSENESGSSALNQRRRSGYATVFAALISSALYAALHFVRPLKQFAYSEYELLIGVEYVGLVIQRMCSMELLPGVLGLFLVGLVLCFVLDRTNSIFVCVGLHTGWAASFKYSKYLTDVVPSISVPDAVGSRYFIVTQPLAWCSILLVGLIVYSFRKRFSLDISDA